MEGVAGDLVTNGAARSRRELPFDAENTSNKQKPVDRRILVAVPSKERTRRICHGEQYLSEERGAPYGTVMRINKKSATRRY